MSLTSGDRHFTAEMNFEGGDVTVALRGSVENMAALELGAILDSAIDRQPTSMVLDLAALEFMGAAGLVAISHAEKRLAALGITLMIQSPTALVNRLLDIMGSAEVSRRERTRPGYGHLGPEQMSGSNYVSQRFGSSLRSKDLRRVIALPADPDVVDGALSLLVELARSKIVDADGVSVSLLRHGVLLTVAASDQTIMTMDADQYATGEGPCVDAARNGHWYHAESLDAETRWPAFTPRARQLGIIAILSSPLRVAAEPIGALNIYSRTASAFDTKDQHAAATFAQKASVILSDAHVGVSDSQMALRFQEALRNRELISLAKGIIMEREGVDEEGAFTTLLQQSLPEGMSMRRRAEEVVRSSRRPDLGPEWGFND